MTGNARHLHVALHVDERAVAVGAFQHGALHIVLSGGAHPLGVLRAGHKAHLAGVHLCGGLGLVLRIAFLVYQALRPQLVVKFHHIFEFVLTADEAHLARVVDIQPAEGIVGIHNAVMPEPQEPSRS